MDVVALFLWGLIGIAACLIAYAVIENRIRENAEIKALKDEHRGWQ